MQVFNDTDQKQVYLRRHRSGDEPDTAVEVLPGEAIPADKTHEYSLIVPPGAEAPFEPAPDGSTLEVLEQPTTVEVLLASTGEEQP